jgi:hypothetical protein
LGLESVLRSNLKPIEENRLDAIPNVKKGKYAIIILLAD